MQSWCHDKTTHELCSVYGTAQFKLHEHTCVQYRTHYTSTKIFATCQYAHDRLMTYKLLVSNINTRCMHNLLAT